MKKVVTVGFLIASMLMLAACGKHDEAPASSGETPGSAASAQAPTPMTPPPPTPAPATTSGGAAPATSGSSYQ